MKQLRLIVKKLALCLLLLGSTVVLMGASPGGESQAPSAAEPFPSKVLWTPDGEFIIFSRGFQGIFMVDRVGSELRPIPEDAPMGSAAAPGYALPALSPDGTRLAFVAPIGGRSAAIMVSALDGSGARRLTQDEGFNTHPAWSPDGAEFAYISDGKLTVIRSDGTNVRVLAPSLHVVNAAPVWSPDGSRIAFVIDQQEAAHPKAVYTVRPDGTDLTKLGSTVSVPSWSPDGNRIAFLVPEEGGEVGLYTLDSAGVEPVKMWSLGETNIWADSFTWSPEGTAILFTSKDGEIFIVSLDIRAERPPLGIWDHPGSKHPYVPKREAPLGGGVRARTAGRWAEWSPDGSRIAVLPSPYRESQSDTAIQEALYTVLWDGRFSRIIVEGDEKRLVAKHPGWYEVSRSIAACSQGYVVSDPAAERFVVPNPFMTTGLVDDCETLMAIRDRLAGDFLLNWRAGIPIKEWWGVISLYPSFSIPTIQVDALWFPYPLYRDDISPEENFLMWVFLSMGPEGPSDPILQIWDTGNDGLTGSVPPELARLSDLVFLNLGGNSLSGNIPLELENLTELTLLDLAHNDLSGSIPLELGTIASLKKLDVQGNALTGCVPMGLFGQLRELKTDGLEYCAE